MQSKEEEDGKRREERGGTMEDGGRREGEKEKGREEGGRSERVPRLMQSEGKEKGKKGGKRREETEEREQGGEQREEKGGRREDGGRRGRTHRCTDYLYKRLRALLLYCTRQVRQPTQQLTCSPPPAYQQPTSSLPAAYQVLVKCTVSREGGCWECTVLEASR